MSGEEEVHCLRRSSPSASTALGEVKGKRNRPARLAADGAVSTAPRQSWRSMTDQTDCACLRDRDQLQPHGRTAHISD